MKNNTKMRAKRPVACGEIRLLSKGAFFILTAFLLVSGCAQNLGRYQFSNEVDQAFKSYRILPDYKYYYTGLQHRPDAILGIHRDYTLDNDLWTEIDLAGAQLKNWVGQQGYSGSSKRAATGYYILDPAGKRIGVWYSRYSGAPIKVEAPVPICWILYGGSQGLL